MTTLIKYAPDSDDHKRLVELCKAKEAARNKTNKTKGNLFAVLKRFLHIN